MDSSDSRVVFIDAGKENVRKIPKEDFAAFLQGLHVASPFNIMITDVWTPCPDMVSISFIPLESKVVRKDAL